MPDHLFDPPALPAAMLARRERIEAMRPKRVAAARSAEHQKTCISCQHPIYAGDVQCQRCGAPTSAAPQPPHPVALPAASSPSSSSSPFKDAAWGIFGVLVIAGTLKKYVDIDQRWFVSAIGAAVFLATATMLTGTWNDKIRTRQDAWVFALAAGALMTSFDYMLFPLRAEGMSLEFVLGSLATFAGNAVLARRLVDAWPALTSEGYPLIPITFWSGWAAACVATALFLVGQWAYQAAVSNAASVAINGLLWLPLLSLALYAALHLLVMLGTLAVQGEVEAQRRAARTYMFYFFGSFLLGIAYIAYHAAAHTWQH